MNDLDIILVQTPLRKITSMTDLVASITSRTRLTHVEILDSTASMYAQSADGAQLGFMIKAVSEGLSLEGRSGDKDLLTGIMTDIANILES